MRRGEREGERDREKRREGRKEEEREERREERSLSRVVLGCVSKGNLGNDSFGSFHCACINSWHKQRCLQEKSL